MAGLTYSTYQGVVCTKCWKVQVIIKIACLICSRSKCMHARSPSPTSSMLKQEWKNLSRYWLIPHYLHKGTFQGWASNQCQNTGRNSYTALQQHMPQSNTSAPRNHNTRNYAPRLITLQERNSKSVRPHDWQVRTRNVCSNPTADKSAVVHWTA